MFDLSADRHGDKKLAMNAMTNTQLWHRRLGHLSKRNLELMQRRDGNGVAFYGSIDHRDVFVVGKSLQLAHPKKAKNADKTALFELVLGDLMDLFEFAVRKGYEYASKIPCRHRVSPEIIGLRNCIPMAFTAESPPAQGQ